MKMCFIVIEFLFFFFGYILYIYIYTIYSQSSSIYFCNKIGYYVNDYLDEFVSIL